MNALTSMPEWDPATKALVDKHAAHCEQVVAAITKDLPPFMTMKLEDLKTALRESFNGALEAVAHNLT